MTRRFVWTALVVLAALSGCDSGGAADPPDALVGTWVSEAHVQTRLVTSDRTQETVDSSRPGEGDLTFRGAATGTLRYASVYRTDGFLDAPDETGASVFSADFHSHPFPTSYASLSMTPGGTGLTVWRDGAYRQFSVFHTAEAAPFTIAADRIVLPSTVLQTTAGETVTVGGTLRLPMLRLEAGVERAIERQFSTEDASDRRVEFGADGTYRESRSGGSAPTSFTGTWTDLGNGRIRIVLERPSGAFGELDYRFDEGRLSLGSTYESCSDDPYRRCRENDERQFALVPGSLTRVRQETADVFARAR